MSEKDRGSVVASIEELRQLVQAGEISREEFWTEMYGHHKELYEYHALLKNSSVRQIEIDSNELRLLTKRGSRFVWLPDDLRIAPSLLVNYGKYEEAETQFLLAAARNASTVVDIGANIGWHSINIAGSASARCIVHAFEPVPLTFQRLQRNIAINDLGDRIVANAFGLSDKQGRVKMFVPAFNGSGAASLAKLHPEDRSEEVDVELRTLDDYLDGFPDTKVDLIKCDVEGAELYTMRGAMRTIERDRPVLFLELLRKWSKEFGYHPNDVIELLRPLGFHTWCIRGDRLVEVSQIDDETVETNFMFLQPGKHDYLLNARFSNEIEASY